MSNKGSVKISPTMLVTASSVTVYSKSALTVSACWRVSYAARLCASLDKSASTQTKDCAKISQGTLVKASNAMAYSKSASMANAC